MPQTSDVEQRCPRVGLFSLAWVFFHLGLSSFSLAVFNEARRQFVERRNLIDMEDYLEGVALAQLMPGAPSVNLVSYLGHRLGGFAGSLIAAVFFLLPSFSAMVLLTAFYLAYGTLPVVQAVLLGMGALVAGLITDTLLNLWLDGANSPSLCLLAALGLTVVLWSGPNVLLSLGIALPASGFLALLAARKPDWGRFLDRPLWRPGKAGTGNDPATGSFSWRDLGRTFLWLLVLLGADVWLTARLFPSLGFGFFRIGALTFGSGYVMLPFIRETVVTSHNWLSTREFGTALAFSLITPGPVTIIAAFVGMKTAGLAGAVIACVNTYLPAFGLVNLASGFYKHLKRWAWLRSMIRGIVAVFIGGLGSVLIGLAASSLHGPDTWALAAAAFVTRRFTRLDTVWIVLAGAVLSALWFGPVLHRI